MPATSFLLMTDEEAQNRPKQPLCIEIILEILESYEEENF